MNPVHLSVDFEDPSAAYALNGRYVAMTYRLLNLFRENNRRATFFTVGRMINAAPDLIREIADQGHEIAFHTHDHLSLTEESPEIFKRETYVDKDRLEQLTGRSVIGFRAPRFSLTPDTLWALDILGELGFRYSSSVMPTMISRFGYASAPRTPFVWKNGMVEFPLPVFGPNRLALPFSGGVYLYLMPFWAVKKICAKKSAQDVVWTYMHPYDFDTEKKMRDMPDTPLWVRGLLSLAGLRAPDQIKRLIALCGTAPTTLGDLAMDSAFTEKLPRFFAKK